MNKYDELFGKKFGRLVPYKVENGNGKRVFLRCKCDCGNEAVIRSDHMMSGASQSCGCLQKERAGEANRRVTPFEVVGDVAIGRTAQGIEFCIDAEDLDKVSDKSWHVNVQGYLQTNIYKDGSSPLLHKIILGDYGKGFCVDHIDRNKLNNRRSNLRICRQKDNAKNQSIRSDNTTGYPGVYKDKRNGKWFSEITADGEKHYLGRFEKLDDAVAARLEAEEKYFGAFAPTRSQRGWQ